MEAGPNGKHYSIQEKVLVLSFAFCPIGFISNANMNNFKINYYT